jgi:hypothetical protein
MATEEEKETMRKVGRRMEDRIPDLEFYGVRVEDNNRIYIYEDQPDYAPFRLWWRSGTFVIEANGFWLEKVESDGEDEEFEAFLDRLEEYFAEYYKFLGKVRHMY